MVIFFLIDQAGGTKRGFFNNQEDETITLNICPWILTGRGYIAVYLAW